jgi:hypothetical protein
MASSTEYQKQCPIFNWETKNNGVLFPYFPMALGQAASNLPYVDLDATASTIHARVRFPMKVRFMTCEAFACSDDAATKGGAASAEPVIGIVYGTAGLASVDAGTSIAVITCDGTGDVGTKWSGTTTETTIETTQELIVHLKTAAASATSANQDGGASVIMWFAVVNAC